MTIHTNVVALAATVAVIALAGCSSVGGLMQSVGGGLSDYSKSNDGFLGKAAGVAGGVYTGVGTAIGGTNTTDKAGAPDQAASAPAATK